MARHDRIPWNGPLMETPAVPIRSIAKLRTGEGLLVVHVNRQPI